MKTKKKKLEDRLEEVWKNLFKYCTNNKDDTLYLAKKLDELCDNMHAEDFFGTEGQCDPRGDGRDHMPLSVFDGTGIKGYL